MGTSLNGLTPGATYQGLIKFGDNSVIGASAKYLSDGLGNDLPISVSTTKVGINTSNPTAKLQINESIGNNVLKIVRSDDTAQYFSVYMNTAPNLYDIGALADSANTILRFYNGAYIVTRVNNTEYIRQESGSVALFNGGTAGSARLHVKGSGATAATSTFLAQNSSASTLFQINDAGLIGIGQAPDSATLPSRLKIAPSNGKIANIGYIAAAGLPATLNDGDIYVYGNDLWLHSAFGNSALKGILSARMKLNGLQSDYVYSSGVAKDFNQFSSSAWATFGWGSLVHTGYSYGNTVLGYQPTSVGVDSRMYDGWLQSVNGNNSYDPCAQLYVDIKGNIFARGNGSYAESDWKKALTDNANKTSTLGSETNYASAKFAVDSTTQGLLPPRMTTVQKTAIASPASGLIVYDTTTNKLCCYNGTSWNDLF